MEHSKVDRRAKELYLSDSGKGLYQFMLDLNDQWVNYVLEDLEPDNMKEFIQTIDRISERAKYFDK